MITEYFENLLLKKTKLAHSRIAQSLFIKARIGAQSVISNRSDLRAFFYTKESALRLNFRTRLGVNLKGIFFWVSKTLTLRKILSSKHLLRNWVLLILEKKSKLDIEGCAFQLFRKEKLVIAEISLRLITFFYLSLFFLLGKWDITVLLSLCQSPLTSALELANPNGSHFFCLKTCSSAMEQWLPRVSLF